MYNQQEIEMVRRQTIQIETEKRALLRTIAIVTSVLCAVCLAVAGFFLYLYVANRSEVTDSRTRIAQLEENLKRTEADLQKKTAELDRRAQAVAAKKQKLDTLLAKAMGSKATGVEIAELAREISDLPQKSVEVASLPPSSLFKYWKYHEGNKTYTYALVPGQIDGKYIIYSNLTAVFTPPPKI